MSERRRNNINDLVVLMVSDAKVGGDLSRRRALR